MKLNVPVKDLSAAIRIVKPALPKRNGAIPALQNAHLSAADGRLTLTVSDLDLTIRRSIPAEVIEPGVALAGMIPLSKAVKGKGLVTIAVEPTGVGDNTEVVTTAGGVSTRLPAGAFDDYPNIFLPHDDLVAAFDVDVSVLASVAPFASADENRPILTGVLFDTDGTLAATNSYFLALVRNGLVEPPSQQLLVPARAIRALLRYVKDGVVEVRAHRRGAGIDVTFTTEDLTTFTARAIEGEFPNYNQLVRQSHGGQEVMFPRPAFAEAVANLKQHCGPATPIRIEEGPAGLRLRVVERDRADVTADLPGFITGPMIALNPEYLLTAVEGLGACTLDYIDALKPVRIVDVDMAGREHVRLLMPVRVS